MLNYLLLQIGNLQYVACLINGYALGVRHATSFMSFETQVMHIQFQTEQTSIQNVLIDQVGMIRVL